MNPNGGGSLGTVNVVGYNVYLNGGSTTTQTASNLSYSFSNGAASIVFPNNNSSYFFAGTELLYFSPDGTFCFGGSTGYPDMLVGVKAPTSGAPSLSGVYATAGISEDESQAANGFVDLQTFYGSLVSQVNNSSYIVENDRINDPFEYYTYSSGYYDLASGIEGSGIYSNGYIKFALNQSGTVRIGAGIGLNPSPLIGLFCGGAGTYAHGIGHRTLSDRCTGQCELRAVHDRNQRRSVPDAIRLRVHNPDSARFHSPTSYDSWRRAGYGGRNSRTHRLREPLADQSRRALRDQ